MRAKNKKKSTTSADVGLDVRPEAMNVTWKDTAQALFNRRDYVKQKGLWYSIAHDVQIGQSFVDERQHKVEAVYGKWKA